TSEQDLSSIPTKDRTLFNKTMEAVKHTGGCHCGAVRFEVWASPHLHVFHCNCSICTKKQNHHFIVPKCNFTLLQGSDNLTTYTFNTHVAKHTFCKTCGVQSFYSPRSNPDGYGVAPHCLDPGSVASVTVEQFCGEQWEETMRTHGTIRAMSRPAGTSAENQHKH
uniref:Centromere protein V n=1 Tax=Sphaeramia orbicularis TaxID=375764 RepID=A0A673BA73_9TELE